MDETLLLKAIEATIKIGGGSISGLQRQLYLSFADANSLIQRMIELGIVGTEKQDTIARPLLIKDMDEAIKLIQDEKC